MKRREQVNSLLKEIGAKLKRRKKHEVWELPNGKTLVRSQTPSDRRSDMQDMKELRHALGDVPEHKEGERREKKRKAKRTETVKYDRSVNSLADQLRSSGVIEDVLKEQVFIYALMVFYQCERIKELNDEINTRWFNRLRLWISNLFSYQRDSKREINGL